MKKYIALLLLVLFCSSTLCVEAAEGSVKILLSAEQEANFTYRKVADWRNGKMVLTEPFEDCGVDLNALNSGKEIQTAIDVICDFDKTEVVNVSTVNGEVEIKGLEEGIYLLEGKTSKNQEVQSALVSIPAWDSEEDKMNYEIVLNPKVAEPYGEVKTGDDNQVLLLSGICVISLLFMIRTLYFSLRLC